LSANVHEKKLNHVMVLFHIPVNHNDNVQLPLNAIKYSVPLAGGIKETKPFQNLSISIVVSQRFLAELYNHVQTLFWYVKSQKLASGIEYHVLAIQGLNAGLTVIVNVLVNGVTWASRKIHLVGSVFIYVNQFVIIGLSVMHQWYAQLWEFGKTIERFLVPLVHAGRVNDEESPCIYFPTFWFSFVLRHVLCANESFVIQASTNHNLYVLAVSSLLYTTILKFVISHHVVTILKIFVSVVPDKNANSEKPTILKSEYKKDKKRKPVPIVHKNILYIFLLNKSILDFTNQINRYFEYIRVFCFIILFKI